MNKTRKSNTKLRKSNRALQEKNVNLLNDMNEMFIMFQEMQGEREALISTIEDKDLIINDLNNRLKVAQKWIDLKTEYIEKLEGSNYDLQIENTELRAEIKHYLDKEYDKEVEILYENEQ